MHEEILLRAYHRVAQGGKDYRHFLPRQKNTFQSGRVLQESNFHQVPLSYICIQEGMNSGQSTLSYHKYTLLGREWVHM